MPARMRRLARFATAATLLACCAITHAVGIKFKPVSLPKQAVTAGSAVHPVNVIGDARKELVVVTGENLAVYALEGDALVLRQTLMLPVPKEANGKTYYGFARLTKGGPHSIVYIHPDGIYYYPVENGRITDSPRLLLKRQMIQGQASTRNAQFFDFAMDLDGDGLDDLLLPEAQGFSIQHQVEPGRFEPVQLPRSPYKDTATFSFQRLLPDDRSRVPSISGFMSKRRGVENLLLYDANGDGLEDLIYSSTGPGPNSREIDRYDIFLQRKDCTFTSAPSQSITVPYESNADVTFRDINRDGRLDAIVIKSNLDVVNPKTLIKFYMAGKEQNQVFSKETDRFVTKDPIGVVRIADFNNDGFVDFALTYFSYQVFSAEDIVDIALSNRLKFRLQFFLGRGGRTYNRQPDYQKELQVNMKPDSYHGYPPIMLPRRHERRQDHRPACADR